MLTGHSCGALLLTSIRVAHGAATRGQSIYGRTSCAKSGEAPGDYDAYQRVNSVRRTASERARQRVQPRSLQLGPQLASSRGIKVAGEIDAYWTPLYSVVVN